MLNLPWGTGMGQGAELSVSNSQLLMHKAAKAESRAVQQVPKGATSSQQRSGEA
jgi:hypothetical protein